MEDPLKRRVVVVVLAILLVPAAARADRKEYERLQFQIGALQGQLSDLLRLVEENQRELRRLNEALAEQTSLLRRTVQDRRMEDEAIQTALRETADRLAELQERVQAAALTRGYAAAPGITLDPAATPDAGQEGGPPAEGVDPASMAGGPPPPPRELYSSAYADFARGNYDLAIQGFEEYLRFYPETDFSDNAQYWIGECQYGKQDYDGAIAAWNQLMQGFASSDKLPDARVKKGMALERLGRRDQALLEYRFVVERYPNSPAARIAREKLNPR